MRKSKGKEAKLYFSGHALMENRNGLLVDLKVTDALTASERKAAWQMISRQSKIQGYRPHRTCSSTGGGSL